MESGGDPASLAKFAEVLEKVRAAEARMERSPKFVEREPSAGEELLGMVERPGGKKLFMVAQKPE